MKSYANQTDHNEPLIIYADDEPLEHILYGEGTYCRKPVNLYLDRTMALKKLVAACADKDWPGVIAASEQLASSREELPADCIYSAVAAIDRIFPGCPNPLPLPCDPSPITPLLEGIWASTAVRSNLSLFHMMGPLLTRFFEYIGQYEEARLVLRHLLAAYQAAGDLRGEASTLNNLGFTYFPEEKWAEALPLFKQAADLYLTQGIPFNYANSMANYWHCRFSLGDWGDEAETRSRLEEICLELEASGSWYERKPLILLARLEERQGKYREAIHHVVPAIRATRWGMTRYPDEDRRYLHKLWKCSRTAAHNGEWANREPSC